MYERFTDRARNVIQLANSEAKRFNLEYVTTEHILLGLLQDASSIAANALRNLGIELGWLYQELEKKIVQPDSIRFSRGALPQSPSVKQLIADAVEEAELLDSSYVGTDHLLLALVRQRESVAAQVLLQLGIKMEDIRGEVFRLLGREIPVEKSSAIPPRPKPLQLGVERERIRSLEQQLWNVRLALGALVGALAGVLLFTSLGAVIGLLVGGVVAALGWRFVGILAGGGAGALLGCVHLEGDGGGFVGALLGALLGDLIADIGGTSKR
jgi:hypothetical protein